MKADQAAWKHDPIAAHDGARELLVGLALGAGLAVLSATWWVWALH